MLKLARHVTLRQLQIFEAIGRLKNFTRVAEELFLTQSTVSTQVKHLAELAGTPLVEVVGKKTYLTQAGEILFHTCQDVINSDIHANHLEGQNAATRRRLSAYRRKTNTYAKSTDGLQRVLDGYWVFHNFIKKHFTTKQVPVVDMGIIDAPFSWKTLLSIQTA